MAANDLSVALKCLAWEAHRLAAEAGKAVNQLAQVTLVLADRAIPDPILTTDDGE